jgi:hypothetical protein
MLRKENKASGFVDVLRPTVENSTEGCDNGLLGGCGRERLQQTVHYSRGVR